jgi:hypothetical protein
MISTERGHARRVAYWQVTVGWATALGILLARAITIALRLAGGPLDPLNLGLAISKSALLLAVVLLYRRYL